MKTTQLLYAMNFNDITLVTLPGQWCRITLLDQLKYYFKLGSLAGIIKYTNPSLRRLSPITIQDTVYQNTIKKLPSILSPLDSGHRTYSVHLSVLAVRVIKSDKIV